MENQWDHVLQPGAWTIFGFAILAITVAVPLAFTVLYGLVTARDGQARPATVVGQHLVLTARLPWSHRHAGGA